MNDISATKVLSSFRPQADSEVQALQAPSLARALAEIRDDSQRRPETYLRDTVVPHGGE